MLPMLPSHNRVPECRPSHFSELITGLGERKLSSGWLVMSRTAAYAALAGLAHCFIIFFRHSHPVVPYHPVHPLHPHHPHHPPLAVDRLFRLPPAIGEE